MTLAATGVVLLAGASARAASVLQDEVTQEADGYRIAFAARLAAAAPAVRGLIGDYTQLPRLSETVLEARLEPGGEAARPWLLIRQRACVLVFCRELQRVMSLTRGPHGDILRLADPARSDFIDAQERWQVHEEALGARVEFHAYYVPRFYIPPLIGPWLVRLQVRRELARTAARIEQLAGERR